MTDGEPPQPREPRGFERYRKRAEKLVGSPQALLGLAAQAARKLGRTGGEKLDRVRHDIETLIDLIRCWVSGDYREVSHGSVVAIVAAIVYFVVPLDLIPDFLLGFGYIDDVAVVSYVLNVLRREIDAFERWREGASGDRQPDPLDEEAAIGELDEDDGGSTSARPTDAVDETEPEDER